jgi:hypothetical protein
MISKTHNLIVLMPPKTASNSIRTSLENQGVIFHKDNQKLPQIHLKLSEITNRYDINNLDNYKIIQIVRNPYLRFVSSFFFQKKIIPNNYKVIFQNYNLEEFSTHLLKSKKTNNFLESFYGDTSFIYHQINNGISWGGSRFYETQTSWNDLEKKINYFKLEEISNNTNKIEELTNLPIGNLSHINSQNLKLDYTSLITSKTKNIIIELFEEDFDNFGYEK